MSHDYSLYKYFNGEEKPPYANENEDYRNLFWYIESIHFNNSQSNSEFHQKLIEELENYLETTQPNENNPLTDVSIPIEKRALIMYVDLMIGKWRPYDGDLIYKY
ncbi:MAG: hypothetical protein JXR27_00910 [Paludibacteraceae bacterium]|nr:hypothetical protein [Paludibacteraceae bacterium]